MKKIYLLSGLLLWIMITGIACKKTKISEETTATTVTTLDPEYTTSLLVYGNDYIFKLELTGGEDVAEYGIAYKAWITDLQQKTPLIGDPGTQKMVFEGSPSDNGTTKTMDITLTFAQFNDASYVAYAILDNGTVIYGAVKFISFA